MPTLRPITPFDGVVAEEDGVPGLVGYIATDGAGEWRDRASTFMLWTDPFAPLAALMKPAPLMPRSTGSLVLTGPEPLDERRMIYPML